MDNKEFNVVQKTVEIFFFFFFFEIPELFSPSNKHEKEVAMQ